MPHINRLIGRKLKEARERVGLQKAELANLLGLSRQGYNEYERGIPKFRVEQVQEFAIALGRPVEWFLGLDTELSEDEAQVLHLWRQIETPEIRESTLAVLRAQAASDRRLRGDGPPKD